MGRELGTAATSWPAMRSETSDQRGSPLRATRIDMQRRVGASQSVAGAAASSQNPIETSTSAGAAA